MFLYVVITIKHLRIHLTGTTYNISFCFNVSLSKCFSKIDSKWKKSTPTPSTLVITPKSLATYESLAKITFFWVASDLCLKKLFILPNLRYLVTSVAPNDPILFWNLKLEIWNIKLIASYEKNVNCTGAISHFNTVSSGQLRVSLS